MRDTPTGLLREVYFQQGPRKRMEIIPPDEYAHMTAEEIDKTWDFGDRHLMHRIAKVLAVR